MSFYTGANLDLLNRAHDGRNETPQRGSQNLTANPPESFGFVGNRNDSRRAQRQCGADEVMTGAGFKYNNNDFWSMEFIRCQKIGDIYDDSESGHRNEMTGGALGGHSRGGWHSRVCPRGALPVGFQGHDHLDRGQVGSFDMWCNPVTGRDAAQPRVVGNTQVALCPRGKALVGVNVGADDRHIHGGRIKVLRGICKDIVPPDPIAGERIGGSGGTTSRHECPANQVMNGLYTRVDSDGVLRVDAMRCVPKTSIMSGNNTGEHRVNVGIGASEGSGTEQTVACAGDGRVVPSFVGYNQNGRLRGVGFTCSQARQNGQTGNVAASTPILSGVAMGRSAIARCPVEGEVAVGVEVNAVIAGGHVDGIKPICQNAIPLVKRWIDNAETTATPMASIGCRGDDVMTGINTMHSDVRKKTMKILSIRCTPKASINAGTEADSYFVEPSVAVGNKPFNPNDHSIPKSLRCPAGKQVIAFKGYSQSAGSNRIARFGLVCASPGSTETSEAFYGENPPTRPVVTSRCAANATVVGLDAMYGWWINRVKPKCQDAIVTVQTTLGGNVSLGPAPASSPPGAPLIIPRPPTTAHVPASNPAPAPAPAAPPGFIPAPSDAEPDAGASEESDDQDNVAEEASATATATEGDNSILGMDQTTFIIVVVVLVVIVGIVIGVIVYATLPDKAPAPALAPA